jgi:hypothetical protein
MVASTTRLPWTWSTAKTSDRWQNHDSGRWYYTSDTEYEELPSIGNQRNVDRIGRIMEFELGEQLIGD